MWAGTAELQYSGKIKIQKRPALFQSLQSFVNCSMKRSMRYNFLLIWRAFIISSHLTIVGTYLSRAFFPILTVHHFLHTILYKMSIFERSVTFGFFQELYSHIDKNSGKKFEDIFLVKIVNKGTSLSCPGKLRFGLAVMLVSTDLSPQGMHLVLYILGSPSEAKDSTPRISSDFCRNT